MRSDEALRLGESDVVLALRRHHHRAHAERPAAERAQDDRRRRQNRVPSHVDGELPAPLRNRARGVAAIHRRQLQAETDDIDENQPEQEERDRAHREQRRHQRHDPPRRARPGLERAENVADDEGDQRRRRYESDRPGQALEDHVADPSGIVGDRIAEIEPAHIDEIDQVLLPERLVDAELGIVFLDHVLHAGVQIAAEGGHLHHLLRDGVLPADPRQEEIERRGEPDDQEEDPDPPREIVSRQVRPLRASRTGRPSSREPTSSASLPA